MYDFIKSIISNGTSPWLNQYDPAAPFYGWDIFSVCLGLFLISIFVFDFPQNPFGRIKFLVMLNVANLLGYAASSAYLMITGLRHSAEWVFIIWLVFMTLPFSWAFYKRFVLGDERI